MAEKYELAYADYKAGMKQKEIAAKYDVSISTVKSWQQRYWKEYDTQSAEEKVCIPSDKSTRTDSEKVCVPIDEISWLEIETEYVTDIRKKPCTLKDLAEKYNIHYQHLRRYASENDWSAKREKHATITLQSRYKKQPKK